MSNQPKPATGEWTVDIVAVLVARGGVDAIVAAHNAALMKLERDWHKVVNEVLKCNPIPARDRADDQLEPPWEVIARIRKQLAAEQSKLEIEHEARLAVVEQLAAAVEALKAARENAPVAIEKVIDAALAKIRCGISG